MSDTITFKIDGVEVKGKPGQTILEAGLGGIRSRGGYQRFSFFKLLTCFSQAQKCKS